MDQKAVRQFHALPHVDDDMQRFETTADLVFQAQIQIDLIEEGDLEATAEERLKLKRFVKRWKDA